MKERAENQALFDLDEPCPARPLVLISLDEPWHKKIVSGEKHYEYRRRYLKQASTAVVYSSGHIRGICAVAKFGEPVVDSPERVAAIGESDQPGIHAGLLRYFGQRTVGFALPIEEYHVLETISLEEIRSAVPSFHPPQSYLYLDRNPTLLAFLRDRAGPDLLC